MMSWIWKVSSTRPWPVSEASDSSATRCAKAARSRMICSTERPPTMERSAPARVSCVKVSISSCCIRKRWAAARMESSLPPTFTMATPSRFNLMPCPETALRIWTMIRRLDRSSTCKRWISGITKTPPPMMTFWPERSVDTRPVSGLVTALPFWPVMMYASFGRATRYLLAISQITKATSRTMPPTPVTREEKLFMDVRTFLFSTGEVHRRWDEPQRLWGTGHRKPRPGFPRGSAVQPAPHACGCRSGFHQNHLPECP